MKDEIKKVADEGSPVVAQSNGHGEISEKTKQLDRDIQLAEMRQKQRLSQRSVSPNGIAVDMMAERGRYDLAKRLVPEAFLHEKVVFKPGQRREAHKDYKPGSTMSIAYAPADDASHKVMINKGWIPVRDEFGQHATEPSGDRLYKRDIVFERDEVKRAGLVTDNAMRAVGGDVKDHAPTPDSIEMDETIIEKK